MFFLCLSTFVDEMFILRGSVPNEDMQTKKDAHCAEPNENSIFQFVFFELWLIVFTIYQCYNLPNVSPTKKIIRSKMAKYTGKMRTFGADRIGLLTKDMQNFNICRINFPIFIFDL